MKRLMSLFLGGGESASTVEVEPDQVWVSTDAKLRGIARALLQQERDGVAAVLLVAHFPDVLRSLKEIAEAYSGPTRVSAVLARQLSPGNVGSLPVDPSAVLTLLVGERHPLPAVDGELLRFAEALPCRCRLVHHLSLEDPLMQVFGADSMRAALERMGMDEDEPIAHSFVSRSIGRAQKKIASGGVTGGDAESAAEWFERYT
jgi:hypothetical protein